MEFLTHVGTTLLDVSPSVQVAGAPGEGVDEISSGP